MAKWMPMITGAIRDGAQKLLSIFMKGKTEDKPSTDPTEGFPEEPKTGLEDKSTNQPREVEPIRKLNPNPFADEKEVDTVPGNADFMPGKEIIPSSGSDETAREDLHGYFDKDRAAQESSAEESEKERTQQEAPKDTQPVQQNLPDLPEWPKTIMESSGISPSSHFSPSGNFATAPQPSTGWQQAAQQASIPQQQEATQAAQPVQPQGIPPAEQVVSGYSRTEKLLEMMLLRGIPMHKPPRGP